MYEEAGDTREISVLSTPFCCESKSALKNSLFLGAPEWLSH